MRAGDVYNPKGIGQVDDGKIPAVEAGVVAYPFGGDSGAGRGGGEVVIFFTGLHDHTIVGEAAVVVAHGRIFGPTGLHAAHVADVHPLQGVEYIRPEDPKLAQGGGIQQAHVGAHVSISSRHRASSEKRRARFQSPTVSMRPPSVT